MTKLKDSDNLVATSKEFDIFTSFFVLPCLDAMVAVLCTTRLSELCKNVKQLQR